MLQGASTRPIAIPYDFDWSGFYALRIYLSNISLWVFWFTNVQSDFRPQFPYPTFKNYTDSAQNMSRLKNTGS